MSEPKPDFPTEGDIDAVLAEFDGDAREAIRALLSDLATFAAGFEGSVSRGYVRGIGPRVLDQEGMAAAITSYVVLLFVRNEDGDLCPEEAIEAQSSHGAAVQARAVAAAKGGAVAFCRTSNPALGKFDEAEIIAKVGDVPVDLLEATDG